MLYPIQAEGLPASATKFRFCDFSFYKTC